MTLDEYWFWFTNINKIGIVKMNVLLRYFNSPERVYKLKEKDFECITYLNKSEIDSIIKSKNEDTIKSEYDKLIKTGARFIHVENKEFPNKLKQLSDGPKAIYVRGNLPKEETISIAIVGVRECSHYGRELSRYFARELASNGVQIISGLARGIDSYAHLGALETKSKTFGILGCGINICYPKENINLYMETIKHGGIISEYGMNVQPLSGNFPMRNRIISGLSNGILVIEAKEKSGALITVDFGLDQGKEIYAIPGNIDKITSLGTNNLIKMGAKLITSPIEILEDFNIKKNKKINIIKKDDKLLDYKEKIVYANLSLEPKSIEELIIETNLSLNEILPLLFQLETKKYIVQVKKNYYVITFE